MYSITITAETHVELHNKILELGNMFGSSAKAREDRTGNIQKSNVAVVPVPPAPEVEQVEAEPVTAPKKKRTSKKKKPVVVDAEVESSPQGSFEVPDLISAAKDYVKGHADGAVAVKQMLGELGVGKVSELDDEGRTKFGEALGL